MQFPNRWLVAFHRQASRPQNLRAIHDAEHVCGGGGEGRWQREHCQGEGEEQGLVVEGEKSKRNRKGKGTVLQT